MPEPKTIDVWADVSCPFAHYSLQRFAERRDLAGANHVRLRVRAWPLELANGEPLTAEKVGHEVPDIRAQVADDLFTGFDPDAFPRSTIGILGAATLAYEAGTDTGEAFNLAVRNALFEDGAAVADPSVLAAITEAHGFALPDESAARAAVEADFGAGKGRGVEGSPTYFVDGQAYFCPSLNIDHEGDHLRIAVDESEMHRFLEVALS